MLQGKEVWLVKLKGVDTPEAAEAFKAQRLMMAASDRPVLEDDEEFYVQELVGMQVTLPTLFNSMVSILSCLLSPEQHECISFATHLTLVMPVQVIMQETGQAVGTVVDLYDGTGTIPLHATTIYNFHLPSSSSLQILQSSCV